MIPIHLKKTVKNTDPKIVVTRTITSVTVFMNEAWGDDIWRHSAKAIAPRMRPEYQHTFNYPDLSGNCFCIMQQQLGSMYTERARASGRTRSIKLARPTALQSTTIPKMHTPRYTNTNASAKYPTVSKAITVPLCPSQEMFMQQQWPIITEEVNREMIPDKLRSSLTKQLKQAVRSMRLVYLIGNLVNDLLSFRKQESPKPNTTPTRRLKMRRQKKSPTIKSAVMKFRGSPSSNTKSWIVLNSMIATASLMMPSPNSTAFRTGKSFYLTKVNAATVSVAHRTLLRSITSGVLSSPSNIK